MWNGVAFFRITAETALKNRLKCAKEIHSSAHDKDARGVMTRRNLKIRETIRNESR